MSKQSKEDWIICVAAVIIGIVTVIGNFYIHGGHIVW
jgi:hypothetical protein